MIRLAIDTSCAPSSLALQQQSSTITHILDKDRSGAEHLICQIQDLMNEAQLNFEALDEILVARGPGPFMSLRVGLAAARGLGLAAKLLVKGASTLAAFATTVKAEKNAIIMALMPSTMNRIVFQSFAPDLSAISPIQIAPRENFETSQPYPQAEKIHLIGPAAQQVQSLSPCGMVAAATPITRPLAEILLTLPAAHLTMPAEPLYPPS